MDGVREMPGWGVVVGEELMSVEIGSGGVGMAVSCSDWNADCSFGRLFWMTVMVFTISKVSFETLRCRSAEMDSDIVGRMCLDSGMDGWRKSLSTWICDGIIL